MDVRRIGLVVAGVALAVVLFLVFRPADEDDEQAAQTTTAVTLTTETAPPPPTATAPAPQAQVVRIRIAGGSLEGGLRQIDVELGEELTLVVTSDVADEVHVHGVDVIADVGPGKPARLTFTPAAAGRYEVELEEAGLQIAQLNVS
jgi:hypothetical protein